MCTFFLKREWMRVLKCATNSDIVEDSDGYEAERRTRDKRLCKTDGCVSDPEYCSFSRSDDPWDYSLYTWGRACSSPAFKARAQRFGPDYGVSPADS